MRPTRNHRFRTHLAGAAVVLAAAFTAAADQGPEPSQGSSAFTDVIDVEIVNVEAWVTDRKGRSVTGLEAVDFEVFEDGVPVEISHFAEVTDAPQAAEEVATAPRPAATAPAPRTPTAEEEIEDPAYLVIFFDESQLAVGSRKRVVEAVREFLDAQRVAAERILIVRHLDGVSAEVRFGSSAEEVRAAVDRLAAPSAAGTRRSNEKQLLTSLLKIDWQTARQGVGDPCTRFARASAARIRSFTEESRVQISSTTRSLGQVVTFLAGTPGVKTLVYVSDGLELRPGADLRAFVDTNCPPAAYHQAIYVPPVELGRDATRLAHHANSNRVTIYTLHSKGLTTDGAYGAENAGTSSMAALRALSKESRSVERDGMVTLANQTGGRASFNTNGFGRIFQEISGYMSTYYSLAYAPPRRGDRGGTHKIEVRVKKPKTTVRHRRNYIAKSSDERMTERLESALFLGTLSNPLEARLRAGEVQAGDKSRFKVPVHLLVPAEKVIFLPHAGRDVVQLRTQIAVHNNKSGKLDLLGRIFRAERPLDGNEVLDFTFDLDLKRGNYELAVGLRDAASGETSYVKTSVAVGVDGADEDGGG